LKVSNVEIEELKESLNYVEIQLARQKVEKEHLQGGIRERDQELEVR